MDPYVAAIFVRRLVRSLEDLGLDRQELLRMADVPPSALSPHRLRLAWSMIEDLIEAAEALTGDPRVGLHLARPHDTETLAVPGLVFLASRDLRTAIARLCRFSRLWTSAYDIRLREAPAPPRVVYRLHRPERPACGHLREHSLVSMLLVVRGVVGPLTPIEVRFEHGREGDLTEYEQLAGCPVRFGQAETAILLDPEDLGRPLPTANPVFAAHFEAQARAELATVEAGAGVAARVRQVIEGALREAALEDFTLDDVAVVLRMAPRTLQRALKRDGESFARLLSDVRRVEAERLLAAGVDIAEVSWRLGYAEPPVFHRAFKRWTGQTPEQWRASQG